MYSTGMMANRITCGDMEFLLWGNHLLGENVADGPTIRERYEEHTGSDQVDAALLAIGALLVPGKIIYGVGAVDFSQRVEIIRGEGAAGDTRVVSLQPNWLELSSSDLLAEHPPATTCAARAVWLYHCLVAEKGLLVFPHEEDASELELRAELGQEIE